MMPERRESTPIRVWRVAVTKPETIPAPMAAGMLSSGWPETATTAPTTAPRVTQPAVERSHTPSME